MQLTLLKSKIHRATVTGASLDYEGSLTVCADIAQAVGLIAYEKILVGNLQNGERFETYVIYGPPGKGAIELNGATAHLGKIGDRKSTRLNSSHRCISYAVFCLKKKSNKATVERDAHQYT